MTTTRGVCVTTCTTCVTSISRITIPNVRDHGVHTIASIVASIRSEDVMVICNRARFWTTATLNLRGITGFHVNAHRTSALIRLVPHRGVALEGIGISNCHPDLCSTTGKIVPDSIGRAILQHVNLPRCTSTSPMVRRHPQWSRPSSPTTNHVDVEIKLLN